MASSEYVAYLEGVRERGEVWCEVACARACSEDGVYLDEGEARDAVLNALDYLAQAEEGD